MNVSSPDGHHTVLFSLLCQNAVQGGCTNKEPLASIYIPAPTWSIMIRCSACRAVSAFRGVAFGMETWVAETVASKRLVVR